LAPEPQMALAPSPLNAWQMLLRGAKSMEQIGGCPGEADHRGAPRCPDEMKGRVGG
jgi:hypothetical protein